MAAKSKQISHDFSLILMNFLISSKGLQISILGSYLSLICEASHVHAY